MKREKTMTILVILSLFAVVISALFVVQIYHDYKELDYSCNTQFITEYYAINWTKQEQKDLIEAKKALQNSAEFNLSNSSDRVKKVVIREMVRKADNNFYSMNESYWSKKE